METLRDFPVWDKLRPEEQEQLAQAAVYREVKKGEAVHNGTVECLGLLVVRSGQLRAYILSEEGRELTIYRLLEGDVCLLSASCVLNSLRFDIAVEAEKDTGFWVIPSELYKNLMARSAPLANYTNEIMASRLSDIMWLMEQVMWKSMDQRLAAFLLEEAALEGTDTLQITHEKIGSHMGTAREVVTRMLRYFQAEGLVKLSRGAVEITDAASLRAISER